MRLIILAAGQGFQLDGFNKILLKDPIMGKTILDNYLEFFPEYDITVVVGYKAISVMNEYPQLDYIYNTQWRVKSNSYSLALALDREPCVILPSDFFFDASFANVIKTAPDDSGLVAHTENRSVQALHTTIDDGKIVDVYRGKPKSGDPELLGIFKISEKGLLRKWKRNCLVHSTTSAFMGENLPFHEFEVHACTQDKTRFHEINTPADYIDFIRYRRSFI